MMKDLYVDEEKSEEEEEEEISNESDNSDTASLEKPELATDSQMPDFLLNPPSRSNVGQADNENNKGTSSGELMSDDDDEEHSEVSQPANPTIKISNGIPAVAVPEMEIYSSPPKVENEDEDLTSEDELISDQEEDIALSGRQKKKKKKKRNIPNSNLVPEHDDDEDSTSFNEEIWLSKKQRKKLQQKKVAMSKQQQSNEEAQNEDQEEADNENETTEDASVANEKVKPEKTKKRSKKEGREKYTEKSRRNPSADTSDLAHCCVTCSSEFPSKNKLFEHLKKTGHSVYIPELTRAKKSQERKEKAAKERDSSDKKRR